MRGRWGQVIGLGVGMLSCVGTPPAPPPQADSGGPASTGSSSTGDPVTGVTSTGGAPTSGDSTDGPGTTTVVDDTSGDSSTGEPAPSLIDDDLLARWYIDEASRGQAPPQLLDAAPSPLDLTIIYFDDSPFFDGAPGFLGLRWFEAGRDGRALAPIADTKIEDDLDNAQEATIELVLSVEELVGNNSRFFHIGTGQNGGDLGIVADDLQLLRVRWNASAVRSFEVQLDGSPQILHLVIDTTQDAANERILAYVDGVPSPLAVSGPTPSQGEGIPLRASSSLVLGNRTDGNRSFAGELSYAAIYSTAFEPEQVQHNVQVLAQSNDSP